MLFGTCNYLFHFLVPCTAPGAHPSNFTGSSLNSTHIFLSWDPPPPGQVNGIIREYRLNVTEAVTGSVLQFNTTPTDRQVTVGPLHPYYTYHCSVTAITVQQGPYTAVYVLQTAEDGNYSTALLIEFCGSSPPPFFPLLSSPRSPLHAVSISSSLHFTNAVCVCSPQWCSDKLLHQYSWSSQHHFVMEPSSARSAEWNPALLCHHFDLCPANNIEECLRITVQHHYWWSQALYPILMYCEGCNHRTRSTNCGTEDTDSRGW